MRTLPAKEELKIVILAGQYLLQALTDDETAALVREGIVLPPGALSERDTGQGHAGWLVRRNCGPGRRANGSVSSSSRSFLVRY